MTAEPMGLLLDRLARLSPLDAADSAAILALPYSRKTVAADSFLLWEGDRPESACLVLSGFLCRHKMTERGRQIVSVHMKGDLISAHPAQAKAEQNVQALTRAEVALIPSRSIAALALSRPSAAVAMWMDALIDGAIFREWIANIGRRDARSRVAHILCEFALRQERAGLATRGHYDLPMTQEQLGDALGLTPVHINRTLKALEEAGLISRQRRSVTIADWDALRGAGEFNPTYLDLELRKEAAEATAASALSF